MRNVSWHKRSELKKSENDIQHRRESSSGNSNFAISWLLISKYTKDTGNQVSPCKRRVINLEREKTKTNIGKQTLENKH